MKRLIKTANLKSDRPSVDEALRRLQREIALARQERLAAIKVIHGYGSSGVGGDIRIAVQKRLHELVEAGEIGGVIFGEDWSRSDERSWKVLQTHPEFKTDPDLGRRNAGVSVVIL